MLDELSHDPARGLHPEREWRDVEEQQVLCLLQLHPLKDGCLQNSFVGDSFVGLDALAQFLTVEDVLEQLPDLEDTGGAVN